MILDTEKKTNYYLDANNNKYHGILVDAAFKSKEFLKRYKFFAKKMDEDWGIYGIELDKNDLSYEIILIRENLVEDKPFYVHFYNDQDLIVIFKDNVFFAKPHISTWSEIINYGKSLGIPEEQLDFWPNRFQDERHYFKKEDLLTL